LKPKLIKILSNSCNSNKGTIL